MKKAAVVALVSIFAFTTLSPSSWDAIGPINKERKQVSELKQVKNQAKKVVRKFSNNLRVNGRKTTVKEIKNSPDIHKAIKESTPIEITNATKEQVAAITGLGIDVGEKAVIRSSNNGESFEIEIKQRKNEVYPLGGKAQPQPGEDRDRAREAIELDDGIDRYDIERSIDTGEPEKEKSNCHRQWKILCPDPHVWGAGRQQHVNHVGWEVNLYNVVDPEEDHKKFLTIRTIGTGVSATAEELEYNSSSHRGPFQAQVIVGVKEKEYSKDWKGNPLCLENSAPKSENNSNHASTSTGITFNAIAGPGITFTGMPMATSNIGFMLARTKVTTSEFHNFSVSFDGTIKPQWTFWLSGAADGTPIRREHQAEDLRGITGIRELPELATRSKLMPNVELVYYADKDETGKVTLVGSVEQKLLEITNYGPIWNAAETTGNVTQHFTVDFSLVHDPVCEDVKKRS